MTATNPTLWQPENRYPTATETAEAWRADRGDNVLYFYNNRHLGITTFEDSDIRSVLRGKRSSGSS
jgi:hypothetical protein